MGKGFTFEQLAVILIVVLGLVVVVVMATTQARKAGESFGDVASGVTETAGGVTSSSACALGGGRCDDACDADEQELQGLGCEGTTPLCCMP